MPRHSSLRSRQPGWHCGLGACLLLRDRLLRRRLLLHLPHRFFVPAGTNAEHRFIWPRLTEVEPLPGRAVHISPAVPEPGMPCQLASPAPA